MLVTTSGVGRVNQSAFNAVAIDAKKLHNSTQTLAGALTKVPGVKLRESGGVGSDMQLYIDGFSGKHVKIFIDGIPQEGAGAAFDLNNVPINFADRIEVYKGVVPVGFGTDAIGGVVNIVTNKQPGKWFMDASYSYGSFNTHKSYVRFVQTFKNGFMYEVNAFQNFSDNDYYVDTYVREFEIKEDGSVRFPPLDKNKIYHLKRFNDQYHNEAVIGKIGLVGKKWADRCQKLAFDEKSLIQVLNLKTLIATNIRKDYSKAFEYNQQALEILQQAQEAMPSGDYLAVMQITLHQTAYLLEAIHEWKQAEEVYLSNIKNLEEQIAVSDNQLFIRIQKGSLLDSYTSLMRLYSQKEDLEKARQTAAKIKEISLNDPDLDEEKRISIELNYLDMLLDFAMNAGQMKDAYKIAAEAYTKAEVLYQKNPITKAAEFLQRYIVYLQLSVDSETDAFPERAELLRTRIEQEFTSLSPDFKINALHNLEMMYSTYYSRKGNQPEERRSLVKAYQYTKKLSESSSSQFTQENLYARAKYIDVLIAESKNQEAAQEALELDALYSIQSAWGYQNLSVESSMGVALVCGGYYELGLKYLERVKEGREKELKKYPHNNELKANTCSTYNNLSLGYSKLKKYKQALKEQLKAYTLMKDLYAQNKAQLGTNYMLITMNVSVNYYQNGDNQQALHYLEEASAIAEEMKALFPQYFATYPIVVKLAKGDLLSKLSQPGAQELLKEGLEYKAGSQPNDALLLYTLKEYHSNGLYTK